MSGARLRAVRLTSLALGCAALGGAVLGCESEPLTEIVVVSDTDLAVPGELDGIRIRVRGEPDRTEEAIADVGAGAPRPVTLGLVSSSGQGALEVAVIGELDGAEVLRRDARVVFQTARVVVLRMDLLRRCVAASCGDGMTCGESGCRAIDVEPSELRDWTGDPGALDAGTGSGDAGDVDAGDAGDAGDDDAGVRDAGTDSGSDAGPPPACTDAADCDDGVPCTIDACMARECVHTPDATACSDSIACTTEMCDPVAGCVVTPDSTMCDDGVACTTETCDPLAGCRSTAVHSSCAIGSYCDPLADCTVAPTFTEVYTTVLGARCGPCHTTSGSPGGGLRMSTQTQAYLSLVGVPAECGTGNVRVIARDSLRSLLWRKVSGVDLCGDLMPRMSMALSAADINLIARWIDGGAIDL